MDYKVLVERITAEIKVNYDIDEKIKRADALMDITEDQYRIVKLEQREEHSIEINGKFTIISIDGNIFIRKYDNNMWHSPLMLACVEPFTDSCRALSIEAYEYPSAFIVILEEGSEYRTNTELLPPPLSQKEKDKLSYYCGYDRRYKQVYEAGALTWETMDPNEILVYLYKNYPEWFHGKIIDLGCGEGRDSLYLARNQHNITGVDISRNSLERARGLAEKEALTVQFIESDIIYLRSIEDNSRSLAMNMGCLHMITDDEQRRMHLKRVYEILQDGGHYIVAHCKENWGKGFYSIPHWEELEKLNPGEEIYRRIRTDNNETMIKLPVLPYKESGVQELRRELEEAGFSVALCLDEETEAFGNTVVLVVQK